MQTKAPEQFRSETLPSGWEKQKKVPGGWIYTGSLSGTDGRDNNEGRRPQTRTEGFLWFLFKQRMEELYAELTKTGKTPP